MSGTKIVSRQKLRRKIAGLKAKGKTIVFTNGCFDILHYGHVQYLENAKACGDILIVGLNSDASVKRIKGDNRPIVSENDRARVLAALESVDYVVLFGEDTPLETIKALKPEILVKGADWKKDRIVGSEFVLAGGGKVKTIRLSKDRSTTNLIKKIAEAYGKK